MPLHAQNLIKKISDFRKKDTSLIIPKILVILGILSTILFLEWLLDKSFIHNVALYTLLIVAFVYKIVTYIIEWLFVWNPFTPLKPELRRDFTVDILTTYVKGEPKDMVKNSLLAIKSVTYPHETFLCDEDDDPELKAFCKEHNIHHVTRVKKIDAKAGNINNALRTVAKGEIVLILDPDHEVYPNFLDEVLPFFQDEKVGYVQVVQAYKNQYDTILAKAAAEQTYQYYGPVMMTLNSYSAAPAIGANCTFRRAALDSIGGHAPGLTEDMHTTLLLKAKGWKSVYNPVVVAKGLVPWNYSGYCLQQLKWSRGSFDLLYNVFPRVFKNLSWIQRCAFLTVPFFYLSGLMALIDFLVPVIALLFNVIPIRLSVFEFVIHFLPIYLISLVIRFYHQRWYFEQHEKGTAFLGGTLFKASWWATLLGFIYSIINKKVPYIPTPKDSSIETPWQLLIPNFSVIALSVFAMIYGLTHDFNPFSLFMAFLALLNILVLGFGCLMAMQKQIVFVHSLFHGSLISKNSRTRRFIFRVKASIYNFLNRRTVALVSILLIAFVNLAIMEVRPSKIWYAISTDVVIKKISRLVIPLSTTIYQKDYGQFYAGINYHKDLKFRNSQASFVKAQFNLNQENEQKIETFLDSCYSNNILPFLTLSVDTGKNIKTHQYTNGLTLADIYTEIKKRHMPVLIMPDRNDGNLSDHAYIEFYDRCYHMADSMAIQLIITWVWNSTDIGNDSLLKKNLDRRNSDNIGKIDWIYSRQEKAILADENYFGLGRIHIDKPLLIDASNIQTERRDTIEKDKYVRNVVGIIGETPGVSHALQFDLKKIFNVPPINNSDRIVPTKYIKGVAYNCGHSWKDNNETLPLTVDKLQEDFKLLNEMGCNTIRRFSPSIYDYNLLKVAKEYDLDILYGFWFHVSVDYYKNKKQLEGRKKDVLEIVKKYQSDSSIVGWGLGNETWYYLKDNFGKPYLSVVRNSYLQFLNDLTGDIKAIDSNRAVYTAETQNSTNMSLVSTFAPQLDFLGINTYYDDNVRRLKEMAQENLNGMPYLVSEYGNKGGWDSRFNDYDSDSCLLEQTSKQKANDYLRNWNDFILPDKKHNVGGVAFCWQDKYEGTATWFGIIDIFGNTKPAYYALKEAYSDRSEKDLINQFPIPDYTIALTYDTTTTKGHWVDAIALTSAKEDIKKYQFKWIVYGEDGYFKKLVESDFEYNNHHFICKIPQDGTRYRIYLYVKDDSGNVITESSPISI